MWIRPYYGIGHTVFWVLVLGAVWFGPPYFFTQYCEDQEGRVFVQQGPDGFCLWAVKSGVQVRMGQVGVGQTCSHDRRAMQAEADQHNVNLPGGCVSRSAVGIIPRSFAYWSRKWATWTGSSTP